MTFEKLALLPFIGHFCLIIFLYIWLTYLRQISVKKNEVLISDYVNANADGETSKRVARNLSNQFELPIFAYLAIYILITQSKILIFDILAAWMFFIGRIMHSYVQTKTKNIPLRGQIFTINFIGILWLVAHSFFVLFN